jgi:hypothetical protein
LFAACAGCRAAAVAAAENAVADFSPAVVAFLLTLFTIVYDKKKGGLLNASAGKRDGGVEGYWSDGCG